MQNRFKVGDIVKHFKREQYESSGGKDSNYYKYQIVAFATHTETGELLVVYKFLYDSEDGMFKAGDTMARPYEMFISKVDRDKYPNVKQEYRFELSE